MKCQRVQRSGLTYGPYLPPSPSAFGEGASLPLHTAAEQLPRAECRALSQAGLEEGDEPPGTGRGGCPRCLWQKLLGGVSSEASPGSGGPSHFILWRPVGGWGVQGRQQSQASRSAVSQRSVEEANRREKDQWVDGWTGGWMGRQNESSEEQTICFNRGLPI